MYLADTNIIIYSFSPKYEYLRKLLINENVHVSEITRVEVFGYHKFATGEKEYYEYIFNFITVVFPTKEIFDKAIAIRQSQNVKLGDSLIAATALIKNLTVYTNNVNDFARVDQLKVFNPLKL